MKKFTLLLSAMLLACATNLWAETATLTFSAKCGGKGTDDKGNAWAVTSDAAESDYDKTKGIHYGTGKVAVSYLTLTNSTIAGTITKIVVNASGASSTSAKLDVTVGGAAFGSQKNLTAMATEYTFEGSAKGEIVVKLSQTSATKALYVKSIAVTYSTAALTSIEIAGEPTKTTYMEGDAFSTEGLKVMGTYEGDDTPKEITTGITWEVTPKTLTAEHTSVEVKATVGDKTATRIITDLTVTAAKTLTSIAVSGTPEDFWKGDTFNHNGMTVTATWNDASTTDVTAEAEFTTPDMATAGTKTITVTYKEKTATYDITVKTIANTQETAYTVAEAIALIDAGKDLTTEVYVKGTISTIDAYNSKYNSITYWLDDDTFEVYSGKGLNNNNFTSENDIAVDGEVIVYGIIKKYSNTYEFDKNNYLVYYKAPAGAKELASITLNGNKTEMESTEEDNEYTVTYTGDGELSITSSNETVAEATIVGTDVVVSVLKAGETTITISAPETDKYLAAEAKYTLTVVPAWIAASLPFTFDGGWKDINPENGIKQSGLDDDYGSSPKLKFDGAGDVVFVRINETADTVSYTIKGNGFSGGTFDVLQSADGVTYSTLATHTTDITGTATKITKTPAADTRYFQFVYTSKSSGNVGLGAIRISKSKSTAIESAAAEMPAVKTIENGQLVIIRDGVKYNAMGVRLQ